ncbi:hypothetical protein [Halorubrum trapanicum]|uniref:hypothetical protein n=1 Tax=Halorubrum trapanicum TaxID=29284 RepID=UPI0012FE65F8|nr:hypothetical protein [Halorubrum trapanicum]
MSFIALLDGEKAISPFEVDQPDPNLNCVECEGPMYVVVEHTRNNGALVSRHFRHNPGVDDSNCNLSGESDIHEKRKTIALSKALVEFEGNCAEWGVEEQIGSKRADSFVRFEEPHPKYGHGLAIEYQHKNISKNRDESTQNYLDEGFTTVWLWDGQFTSDDDVDLFEGEVVPVWPTAVPDRSEWGPTDEFEFDMFPLRSWTTSGEDSSPGFSSYLKPDRITRHRQTARDVWDFEFPDSPSILVRLPDEWYDRYIRELWDTAPWDLRFDDPGSYGLERWIASASDEQPEVAISVILPPEYYQELATDLRRSVPWEQFFSGTVFENNDSLRHPRSGVTGADSRPDVTGSLPFVDWLIDTKRVIRLKDRSSSYRLVSLDDADPDDYYRYLLPHELALKTDYGGPEPPPGTFDDVQCRNCGRYWYVGEERLECQKCGSDVDWDWNMRTGRIGSVPDYVE